MEKAKYLPDEINKIIDEEISRIDTANALASAPALQPKSRRRSSWTRFICYMRARFIHKQAKQ